MRLGHCHLPLLPGCFLDLWLHGVEEGEHRSREPWTVTDGVGCACKRGIYTSILPEPWTVLWEDICLKAVSRGREAFILDVLTIPPIPEGRDAEREGKVGTQCVCVWQRGSGSRATSAGRGNWT